MPAPVIQSSQATSQSTAASISAAPPAGIVDGDLLLAIHSVQDASSTNPNSSPPGDWTSWLESLGWARNRLSTYAKIASGESGNYQFDATATLDHVALLLRISGVAATGYLHQANANAFLSATDFVCPAVITTVPDCLILYLCNWTNVPAPSSVPSGTSLVYSVGFSGETSQRLMVYSKTLSTPGNTGTGTFVRPSTGSGSAMTLAIAPRLFNSAWAKNSNGILVPTTAA